MTNRGLSVRSLAFALILGLGGVVVLVSLGIWQLHRLEWKRAVLAEMDARIHGLPSGLPASPSADRHNYLAVSAVGYPAGEEIHVLTSRKGFGPGYRLISAFATEGRIVLVDLGFIAERFRDEPRAQAWVEVTGNLHWPREHDRLFTPEPDGKTWFARRVPQMAEVLETEPLLIVARQLSDRPGYLQPWPVASADIPNNHLQYAITWFAMAVAWAGMTAYWLWRIRREPKS